jgi:trk system potassium uptake protein TrkH
VRINTEFRWYVALMLFFCGMVSWILWKENTYGLMDAIRYGTFQVTSLLTTTGFTTADYEQWPQASQMFLYAVCFIGACAGSTTSGIKIVHYVVCANSCPPPSKKSFFSPCPSSPCA